MNDQPQKEHEWLHRLLGSWTFEGDCSMGPDKPRAAFNGTEVVRSLGGFWVIAEGDGDMPCGGRATTVMTVGYDPRQGRYVGTWAGSMMSHMFHYVGTLDDAGTTLTLETEGPSPSGDGTMAKFRDVITLTGDGGRTLTAYTPGEDGRWMEFMTARYRLAQQAAAQ